MVCEKSVVAVVMAFELWHPVRNMCNASFIPEVDITILDVVKGAQEAFQNFQELVPSYSKTKNLLRADREVRVDGTVVTKAGAYLMSNNVLKAVKKGCAKRS